MKIYDIVIFYAFFLAADVFIIVCFNCMRMIEGNKFTILIAALHFRMLITFAYYFYTLNNVADAIAYFKFAEKGSFHKTPRPGLSL